MFAKETEFDWPLDYNVIRKANLVNTFGMVRVRSNGTPKPHQGWDLYALEGTPCYAVAEARVMSVGYNGDYGNVVVLYVPGPKLYIAYCHLSKTAVIKGQQVALGQVIGFAGTSGNAAGMKGLDQHLHFEVRTLAVVGLGLEGRISPIEIFRVCPLAVPIKRERLRVRTI